MANLEIEVKQAGKALGDVRERLAADGGAADVQQTQAVLRLRLADAQPLDLATTAAQSRVRECPRKRSNEQPQLALAIGGEMKKREETTTTMNTHLTLRYCNWAKCAKKSFIPLSVTILQSRN